MNLANAVLAVNDDLPIKSDAPVHSGKVRSVYWLTAADSRRLIKQNQYDVPDDAELAVMVISDRISAFDCIWQGEQGLNGVPGKGESLNAISNHWFQKFKEHGLADSHILDVPHPYVWIVQKARPIMIEAIARQYITGSMWRSYAKGEREFCGITLPDNLKKDQKLPKTLITPSTKGILKGIPNVPEADDANVANADIELNFSAFKFNKIEDVKKYQALLLEGFGVIESELASLNQIFVDTKFEFGYVTDASGQEKMIYMDEVGTPDSSRIWDGEAYANGSVIEKSKEGFRQQLLSSVPDADVLLNKNRMEERAILAQETSLPTDVLMDVSDTYRRLAEKITGKKVELRTDPKAEIIAILADQYDLIK
jgi:phosphoribosylaminoimidazole-succinocarboxamide synthase